MSFDYKLARTCDHQIFWEIAEFDTEDMRSLYVSKPIISSHLRVRVSGNLLASSDFSLVDDLSTTYAPKKVYLKERQKSIDDTYEVTYITDYLHCPKCVGLKVLDDLQFSTEGKIVVAKDEYLLLQNVEKNVITELGSNTFHTWEGTSLIDLTGSRIMDTDYLKTKISQDVNAALNKFKSMQNQQLATQRPMSDGEILESVDSVIVSQDVVDPTVFRVDIVVRSRSNKSLTYQQYLKFAGSSRQRA
jgi:hypothetical protein